VFIHSLCVVYLLIDIESIVMTGSKMKFFGFYLLCMGIWPWGSEIRLPKRNGGQPARVSMEEFGNTLDRHMFF
jgi:hypothetical protein